MESDSVAEWGQQTSVASVDILQVTPTELVAPIGVWFEATNISGFDVSEPTGGELYDPTAHGITWVWDFDDPGTFATPLNIPNAWNNKSLDYGKKVFHVFDAPGTYNVRLRGYDQSGTPGERTVPVQILDPELVYAGTRTICVSTENDFTGAPAGATQVSTLNAARLAAMALGQTGRILLRAGETFNETLVIDDPMVNCRIGSFGAGEKPILRMPIIAPNSDVASIFSYANQFQVRDSIFYGLRFEGEWDAATETGDPRGRAIAYLSPPGIDFYSLVYQCEIDGMGAQLFNPPSSTYDHTLALVDCDVTNWQDYGVWFGRGLTNYRPNSRFAVVGSSIHQKRNACRNGQGKIGLGNDHGPLRHVDVMQGVISTSDFYSANSWVSGVQPCMRLAQADSNNPGGYFLNINRVACEGGAIGGIDGQNGNAPERPGNHVLDTFLFVSDYSSLNGFAIAYGGTTVRNGLIIRQDMTHQRELGNLLQFNPDNSTPENDIAPVDAYNITLLNLSTDTGTAIFGTGNFSNITVENNIIHAPNVSSPMISSAPIDLSTNIPGFSPRSPGERVSVEKVLVTNVSVSNGATLTVPYPTGTSAADFSTGGRHTVLVGGYYYFSYRGECTLSFGGSNITITNTSGDTWSGDLRIGLDQATIVTLTQWASPSTVPLPVPQTGSNALLNEGGYLAYSNFLTEERTGPWKGAL